MPVIDPSSIFGNIKTYADYQKAEEEFALKKAAATQQLTTGAIDAETKKNTYAAQLLSAATANGDQYTYDAAKAHLNNLGIDVSMFAPDVQSGSKQAQALRLATSPLGSLLGASERMYANDIAAATAMGNAPPARPNVLGLGQLSQQAQQTAAGLPPAPQGMPAPQGGMPAPRQAPGVPPLPAETPARGQGQGEVLPPPPMALPGGQTTISTPSPLALGDNQLAVAGISKPAWSPPQYDQTKNVKWNQDNFANYVTQYQNDPNVKAYNAAMEAQAKQNVEKLGKYSEVKASLDDLETKANTTTRFIDEALNIIKNNPNSSVGYGYALTPSGKPGAARELDNALLPVKSNLGLTELQKLKTQGATLGQVTEAEHRLLQALQGVFDPKQPEQLIKNLQAMKEYYPLVLAQKKAAFYRDYGKFNIEAEQPTGATPFAGQAQPASNAPKLSKAEVEATLFNARKAIANGKSFEGVAAKLQAAGIDPMLLKAGQ